jgi:hypothetical protein
MGDMGWLVSLRRGTLRDHPTTTQEAA